MQNMCLSDIVSSGGIPPCYFTVYFNITICHVANSTTLNGHIVLVILIESRLLKRIKVKFQYVWCYRFEKKIKTHTYPSFFGYSTTEKSILTCVHFFIIFKQFNIPESHNIFYFLNQTGL